MNDKTTQEILSEFDEACKDGDFGAGIDVGHMKGFLMKALAKHEAELVERVRTEVIGSDDIDAKNTMSVYGMAAQLERNKFREELRAKLTALSEKEKA